MTKLRSGDPWMPAPEYGHTLRGLTVNLVVQDIEPCLEFQSEVLEARIVYADPDVAVLERGGAQWMLHARHTYDAHPLYGWRTATGVQCLTPELRVHGRDPDAAEQRARELGYEVVAPTADKPHGLRECYLRDGEGYLWVPDVPA